MYFNKYNVCAFNNDSYKLIESWIAYFINLFNNSLLFNIDILLYSGLYLLILPLTLNTLHNSFKDTGNILNESFQIILLSKEICINLFLLSIIVESLVGST